jgi:hypothetical protein
MSEITDAIAVARARHRVVNQFICSCGYTGLALQSHITEEIDKAVALVEHECL